ncbi:MAG: glucose-6-phosphate isomerase [bacterium]|nr:glucose-6-phosphate isomerase [bacterium]
MARLEVRLENAGVTEAELARYRARLGAALAKLDAGADGEFLRVIEDVGVLREIRSCIRSKPAGIRDVVQLGIGGSSLGGQSLCAALLPALHNERLQSRRSLTRGSKRPSSTRTGLRFHYPDNVDPESFAALLETLDPRHTLVHVVSKSGGTLETLVQLHALLEAWKPSPAQIRKNFVVTTGESGTLREFADRYQTRVLRAPADVSGRFSVFTSSGLLVPALCGVPVQRVLAGARSALQEARDDALLGPAGRLAALHHLQQAKGRPIHVEMIYSDALVPLGHWFAQIWAESLGKGGNGPTPVVARGTTDQHSQIQLYVDGPDDKLYTVVRVRKLRRNLKISRGAEPAVIAGAKMSEVFDAEAQGTVQALCDAQRPLVEMFLERINPEAVGALLMTQQLQTALAGSLYGVNPFDQPGVEAGKQAALRILEKAD